VNDFTVFSNAALGVSGTVPNNDLNVAGATVWLTQGPTQGNLTLNANGTFQYAPEPGFETGTYEFTYQLTKPGFDPTTARFVMDLR
jgi:hypothetical protein